MEGPRGLYQPETGAGARSALSRARPGAAEGFFASYDDGTSWLKQGLRRQRAAVLAALVFSWTGMLVVPWGAAVGSLVGTLVGLGIATGWAAGHHLFSLGPGQAASIVGVAAGFCLGLVGGILLAFDLVLTAHLVAGLVSIMCGAGFSIITVVVVAMFERAALRIRGYRRLSRLEVRRVAPLVKKVADAMDLDGLPRFAMSDGPLPNAWTHMRTIVLTTGLLQMLDDAELTAVLAHELHHWRSGDAVGLRLVWAAALPIALLLDVGSWIAGGNGAAQRKRDAVPPQGTTRLRPGVLAIVGWVIAWAPWVITRFILAPVSAATQRRYEYEADAAASAIGLATSLSSALGKLGAFEAGRAGWERAMVATHPATELRLEALERPRPDDASYQERDLGLPSLRELRRILRSLI
jgi:Zn-dependent protease with chaperone function